MNEEDHVRKWYRRIALITSIGVLVIGLSIIAGHIFGIPWLYTWGSVVHEGMAINTAILFVMTALMILCLRGMIGS